MFREDYQEKKSQKELSETFSLYLTKQQLIQSYPEELIPVRTQIVDWLIFLCHNLSFKTETLFRAISIFDLYISRQNSSISFYEVKLVAIASLSISTKIEEINKYTPQVNLLKKKLKSSRHSILTLINRLLINS